MAYLSFTQDNKRENKVVETEIKMLKQMPTWKLEIAKKALNFLRPKY